MDEAGEPDAVDRLADAAARLKATSESPPGAELQAPEGLALARLEVRRARARLAELEADLAAVLDGRELR